MKRKRHERAETRNVEEWLRKLSVDNIFLSDLGIPSVLLQLIKSYLLFDLPLGYILRVESRICHPRRHSFWHLRSRYVEVSGPLVVHYGSLSYSTVQRERKRTKDDEKNLWISRTNRSVYNHAYHTRKKKKTRQARTRKKKFKKKNLSFLLFDAHLHAIGLHHSFFVNLLGSHTQTESAHRSMLIGL